LHIQGLAADYHEALADLAREHAGRDVVLFLGSNIGNFTHARSRHFLRRLRRSLRPGDLALVGFDLVKDPDVLRRAYNDAAGVTREFNFNLLDRINRELGGTFDRHRFTHCGTYNVRQQRMESWLVSTVDQEVLIRSLGRSFAFRAWEGIHVESSYKYSVPQIEALATAGGFHVRRHFFDARGYFVDSLWEASKRG
jgi:uncharacterized SAM-dependent methyltransferase